MSGRIASGNGRRALDERTVLRVRGTPKLADTMQLLGEDAGRVTVPIGREVVARGQQVRLELSLGALADEVVIDGRVFEERAAPVHGREAVVSVISDHVARLRYARAVLFGERPAAARGSRRVSADLPVLWERDGEQLRARTLDLSRGGAFIRALDLPEVGERLAVELPVSSTERVQVPSVVAWVSDDQRRPGFGVSFKFSDRGVAAMVQALVRKAEACEPLEMAHAF